MYNENCSISHKEKLSQHCEMLHGWKFFRVGKCQNYWFSYKDSPRGLFGGVPRAWGEGSESEEEIRKSYTKIASFKLTHPFVHICINRKNFTIAVLLLTFIKISCFALSHAMKKKLCPSNILGMFLQVHLVNNLCMWIIIQSISSDWQINWMGESKENAHSHSYCLWFARGKINSLPTIHPCRHPTETERKYRKYKDGDFDGTKAASPIQCACMYVARPTNIKRNQQNGSRK